MLVVLALVGLGLMALRQTRTEMSTTGNLRVSRQAYEAAYAGLIRTTLVAQSAPDTFHRLAVQTSSTSPSYTFGRDIGTTPPGVFTIPSPFAEAQTTRDQDRVGHLEYQATMSRPMLAPGPPGFQVAGGAGNRFVFYEYQFNVLGWVNREPDTANVQPGTASARKQVQACVRLGPIAANQ